MTDTLAVAGAQRTAIPDIRRGGLDASGRAAANAAILKRILQNKGVEVPVAAFQSSI